MFSYYEKTWLVMFYSEGFFSRGRLRQNITYSQKVRNLTHLNKMNQTYSIHCKKRNIYNVWTEMAIVWMSVEQQMVATLKFIGYV